MGACCRRQRGQSLGTRRCLQAEGASFAGQLSAEGDEEMEMEYQERMFVTRRSSA